MFKMKLEGIQPMGNFVLCEQIRPVTDGSSTGGILLPGDTTESFPMMWARVLKIGFGPLDRGERGAMLTEPGNIVGFHPPDSGFAAPVPMDIEGHERCFMIMENYLHVIYSGEVVEGEKPTIPDLEIVS